MADGFDFEQDIPQEQLATEAQDSKHKRIVCRFWLNGECIHEHDCKFLHVMDLARMPECRWGGKCQKRGCMFKHTPDEEKEECANYRVGFCSFGPVCKFRHEVQPASSLPPVSEMWTPEYVAEQRAQKRAENDPTTWRVTMCPVMDRTGWCSFFDQCSYAHNPTQLRRYGPAQGSVGFKRGRDDARFGGPGGMRRGGGQSGGDFGKRPRFEGGGNLAAAPATAGPAGAAGGVPAFAPTAAAPTAVMAALLDEHAADGAVAGLPDALSPAAAAAQRAGQVQAALPSQHAYFIMRTASPVNLALSLKRGEWITTAAQAERIARVWQQQQQAAAAGSSGVSVFLIFSILGSQHYQGVARVRAAPQPVRAEVAVEGPAPAAAAAVAGSGEVAAAAAGSDERPLAADECACVPVEWLRTCALPLASTAGIVNTVDTPGARSRDRSTLLSALLSAPQLARAGDGQEVEAGAGRCLMLLLHKAPYVAVDVSAVADDAVFGVFNAAAPSCRAALDGEAAPAEVAAAEGEQAAALAQRQQQHQAMVAAMAAGLPPAAVLAAMEGGGMPAAAAPGADAAAAAAAPVSGVPGLTTAAAAARGLPPILMLPSLPGGTPANPVIAMLVNGMLPPGAPAPAVVAADAFAGGQDGYLFGINNVTADMCLESGVFAAPEEFGAAGAHVAAGTPILVFHIHARTLHGLFLARGPLVRDLVPRGTFPVLRSIARGASGGADGEQQQGAKRVTTLPLQCQTLCVALAPPMPQAAFAPLIGGRPMPGRLPAAQVRAVAAAMFSALPQPLVLRAAGLLRQMQAVGMPKAGLLVPQPAAAAADAAGGAAAPAAPALPSHLRHAAPSLIADAAAEGGAAAAAARVDLGAADQGPPDTSVLQLAEEAGGERQAEYDFF